MIKKRRVELHLSIEFEKLFKSEVTRCCVSVRKIKQEYRVDVDMLLSFSSSLTAAWKAPMPNHMYIILSFHASMYIALIFLRMFLRFACYFFHEKKHKTIEQEIN